MRGARLGGVAPLRQRAGPAHESRQRPDPDVARREPGDGVDDDARRVRREVEQEQHVELAGLHHVRPGADVRGQQVDRCEPGRVVAASGLAADEDGDAGAHVAGDRAAQASSIVRSRKCVAQLMQGS